MAQTTLGHDGADREAFGAVGRFGALFGVAAGLAALGLVMPGPWPAVLPLAAGGTVATVALLLLVALGLRRKARSRAAEAVGAFIEHDAAPSFTTDAEGIVRNANAAARERFEDPAGAPLAHVLRTLVASPSALLSRLQSRARAGGSAREDVVTRRGHVRVAVHRVGQGDLVWRLEDLMDRAGSGRGAEALSLPMMTVGKSGAVLFMNDALRRLVGGRVKTLDRIFTDLPLRPDDDHIVHGADGDVRARVVEVPGPAGRREIFLIPSGDKPPPPLAASDSDIFERLPVALLKIGRDGAVRMANKLARNLILAPETPGTSLTSLLEGLGRPLQDWLEDAVAGRAVGKPETLRARKRDTDTYVQVTLERMEEAGEVALIAVLNDATELKTLEAQFVQSQKMQAIGQLAGGVAHDFNNLLTAICGHCDLLLLRHAPDDPDYGDLVQINQNANRAASLVGQLLAFSRKQTLQLAAVDLEDTLGELTHLLNRLVGERVTLTLSHDPDLRPIRADKRQLEQVIMNLVVNARDAMADGGQICIQTELRRFDTPFRRDRAEVPAGEYVLVRVTDDGVGIEPENLSKIFEPFFSTKGVGEGTGLGLSTAYGIVKQSGGFIFADSVVGSGTTFTLFFPVHVPEATAPQAVPARSTADQSVQGEGVVLLVEDEAPVRAFASRALRMRGYTVIEAENAEEALRALEDDDLQVDVFVTDVIMPGMDGPSWVRKALEQRPDAKVVFVSGYAEEHFGEERSRLPNSVFLPKPFSLSDLTATVHDQIH